MNLRCLAFLRLVLTCATLAVVGCGDGDSGTDDAGGSECLGGEESCPDAEVEDAASPHTDADIPETDAGGGQPDAGPLLDAELDAAEAGGGDDAGTDGGMDATPGADADADAAINPDTGNGEPDGAADTGVSDADAAPQPDTAVPPLTPCTLPLPAGGDTLLDVGHRDSLWNVVRSQQRILSHSWSRWILWSGETGGFVADGAACESIGCPPVALAHSLVLIPLPGSVELRDAGDGHLLTSIAFSATRAGVAPDGSFAWLANGSELRVVSPAGAPLMSASGNFATAQFSATGSLLRVAGGPGGTDVIDTYTVATGGKATSGAFLGTFREWFEDGERFVTTAGNAVRVYSNAAVQQKLFTIDFSILALGGFGDHLWFVTTGLSQLHVYAVSGAATPVLTTAASDRPGRSRSKVALPFGTYFKLVELAGATPSLTQVESSSTGTFGVNEAGAWSTGFGRGVVNAQIGASNSPRALNCGALGEVALAADGTWAASVSLGQILLGDVASRSITTVVPFAAVDPVTYADAATLRLAANANRLFALGDSRWRAYSLPAATTERDIDRSLGQFADFEVSRDGSHHAELWCVPRCEWRLFDAGTTPYYTALEAPSNVSRFDARDVRFSASGARVSLSTASSHLNTDAAATEIYEGSSLVGAAEGYAAAWLDADRLLLATYQKPPSGMAYKKMVIVDRTGAEVAPSALPQTLVGTPLAGGARIFAQGQIRDVTSGTSVWTLPVPFWTAQTTAANETHAIADDRERLRVFTHP